MLRTLFGWTLIIASRHFCPKTSTRRDGEGGSEKYENQGGQRDESVHVTSSRNNKVAQYSMRKSSSREM